MTLSTTRDVPEEVAALLLEFSQDDGPVTLTYRGKAIASILPREGPAPSRHSETLFTETERLFRLGHWEWDEIEDRCIYCSPEFARLHGTTVDGFLEQSRTGGREFTLPRRLRRNAPATEPSATAQEGV